ncbi:hypothetical protein [Rhodohalobacter sp. 8-1]
MNYWFIFDSQESVCCFYDCNNWLGDPRLFETFRKRHASS